MSTSRRALVLAVACLFVQGCESPPPNEPAPRAAPRTGGRDRSVPGVGGAPAARAAEAPQPAVKKMNLPNVPLASVRNTLAWGPRSFPCRAEPGGPPAVMFAALGDVTTPACDSVYDPDSDRMYTFRGPAPLRYVDGAVSLDLPDDATIDAVITENFIRDVRGVLHYAGPPDKSRFPRPPSGWCSWYFYYQDVSQEEIVRNARWMAENLKPFGAEYVQLDDGWQGVGKGVGDNRDWETIDQRFPNGMRWLADQIHALGLKAGLWIAPHGQSNTAFVQQHYPAFLWRADGRSAGEDPDRPDDPKKWNWEGRYIVDTSGPDGQSYLRRLFARAAREWNFDYFKIDGQPLVQDLYQKHRDRMRNPSLTPQEAYRAGLYVIRDAIGPGRFLLGCWGVPWWGAGIMNGCRTGGDVWAAWDGLRPALDATWKHYWSHNVVWYADPDVLCVRPPLTLEQARVWASVFGLTGQALLASDKMYELPDDRVELLRRVFPPADVRPMNLHPVDQPDVVCLKIKDAAGRRDIVGVFNWGGQGRTHELTAASIGLDPGNYLVYDVWGRRLLGRLDERLSISLEPTSCRVLCVRAIEPDKPTLIGTSRHITQGAVDVESYGAGANQIEGVSRVVGGDPYEIRFFLQPGRAPFEIASVSADGVSTDLRVEGPVATLTLSSPASTVARWSLIYAVPGAETPVPDDAPRLAATFDPDANAFQLAWTRVASASGYRVLRDGQPVATTPDAAWRDPRVRFGRPVAYQVEALRWNSPDATPSNVVSTTPPAPTDRYLDEMQPIRAEQGFGSLSRNKTIEGNRLAVGGRTFERGLGTHARSVLTYNLGGGFSRFTAAVGVDDETIAAGQGSVIFIALVDGVPAFNSGVMRTGDPPRNVDVDLTAAQTLELVVDDAGDGVDHDHADWADARLLAAERPESNAAGGVRAP